MSTHNGIQTNERHWQQYASSVRDQICNFHENKVRISKQFREIHKICTLELSLLLYMCSLYIAYNPFHCFVQFPKILFVDSLFCLSYSYRQVVAVFTVVDAGDTTAVQLKFEHKVSYLNSNGQWGALHDPLLDEANAELHNPTVIQ